MTFFFFFFGYHTTYSFFRVRLPKKATVQAAAIQPCPVILFEIISYYYLEANLTLLIMICCVLSYASTFRPFVKSMSSHPCIHRLATGNQA